MKNYILITDKDSYCFESISELKKWMFPNFDKMTKEEQKEYLYEKVFGFCALNDLQIIDTKYGVYKDNYKINEYEKKDLDNSIIIDNTDTYILSLCKFNIIVLLEEKDNRFYTKESNVKFENDNNYVKVNSFANKLLMKMVGELNE